MKKQSMSWSRNKWRKTARKRTRTRTTTTDADRLLLRRISRWVRRQVIPGGFPMVCVRVEVDSVVTHIVALAGLVVDLQDKAVECVCVCVDQDDHSKTQGRATEARPPMFRHSHWKPYKTVGPLAIVREYGWRHPCVSVEERGQYKDEAEGQVQAV